MMKSLDSFANDVIKKIRKFLPEEYQSAFVAARSMPKTNDKMGIGLTIQKEGQMPFLFDLEPYYQMLVGGNTEEMILPQIAREYLDQNQMMQDLQDFEKIKGALWIQLIAKESNQERLKGCPYKDVAGTNLVATFHLRVDMKEKGRRDLLVVNRLLDQWGLDVDSLYGNALQNMQQQMSIRIGGIGDVLRGEGGSKNLEGVSCDSGELYVLTNTEGEYGAAALLYPGLLQTLAENSNADLFILPSSIHEVLVMKADGAMEAKELQCIVMDINQSIVKPEEVLSNQVYRYDRESQSLSLTTTREETEELLGGFPLWGMHGQAEMQGMDMDEQEW